MKEEIEKESMNHMEVDKSDMFQVNYWNGYEDGFEKGADWMLSKYNGLSPDTVKEMYEALKELWQHVQLNNGVAMNGSYSPDSVFGKVNTALTKSEQELKK